MSKLTAKEKKWFKKVQAVLDDCPSDRIAFYSIGDANIVAYDHTKYDEIAKIQDSGLIDFCNAVERADACLDEDLTFNNPVGSVAG